MSATTAAQVRRPAGTAAAPPIATTLTAVVRRGLRDHRRAPLTWGGALGALGVLMALTWPSIEGSVEELIDLYPENLGKAFNIEGITTVNGYIDAEMLSLIVPLTVSFMAVRLVTRATAGAEERRWLDTLLAVPISRGRLVAGSFIVTALVVLAVLATTCGLTLLAAAAVGADPDAWVLTRGFLNIWPLALFFAGLAMLAAGVLHSAARVTAIAAGALVAMYVIDLVGKLAESLDWIRYASAFKYSGSAVQDGIDPFAFVGLFAFAVGLAAAGAWLFERRDVFS